MKMLDEDVASVRAFNRFYTTVIGVLNDGLLQTPYSLTEARVIFELAQSEASEHLALRRALDIDAGHLSRILTRFESDGLVQRERSEQDGRRQVIRLTDRGRELFAVLDSRSAEEIATLLSHLTAEDRRRLTTAMETVRTVLDTSSDRNIVLRQLGPGDIGWVVQRHGVLYWNEYGWDQTFEALVARIVADYVDNYKPQRENAWIAEVDGKPVGCIFCVEKDETIAQLRILLVEPSARGMGIGSRLVEECLQFARMAGYREIMLWTNDVLEEARRIYQRAGFELTEEEPHHSFGHDLIGQNWVLRFMTQEP